MKSTAPLTGSHLRTYHTIFQHPASHTLAWLDVHALFRHLGEVEVSPDAGLKVTRNGEVLILHAPRTKEVSTTDELLSLRHFLTRSGVIGDEKGAGEGDWLVVIDHREARIYRSLAPGSSAQQIRPHVSEDYFRHAPNSAQISRGKEKPDPNSFFEPVAAALSGAKQILLFGSGTGTSSEMDQFAGWLKQRRPEVAKRVIGTLVIDETHLSEAQVLAKAREFYATPGGA
ncbi:MAG: hypothetical protein NTV51_18585 [Verrucomicrobia bacterium]|nr:hypothetical protein [Verrucomicrobiota bacterium]